MNLQSILEVISGSISVLAGPFGEEQHFFVEEKMSLCGLQTQLPEAFLALVQHAEGTLHQ